MTITPLYSPDGDLIIGTLERLRATATLHGAKGRNTDGTFALEYEGRTEVDWDSQETVKRYNADSRLERVFVDDCGEVWFESQLTEVAP